MELKILPPELEQAFLALPAKRQLAAMELRFRVGSPVKLVFPWGEELLMQGQSPIPVTDRLLRTLVDRATGFSPYTLRGEEAGLFLPLKDGCRLGLCGEAVMQEGRIKGIRHVSSAVIRLAREKKGIAEAQADRLIENGMVQSALIVSPPGRGKTTFLRDLIRCVSTRGFRVSVVDERRELAAVREGRPQLDVGPSTDVLSLCPKAQAIPLMVRVMTPQVLALDELSGEAELEMAREAAFCGVALFATAHGDGLESLLARPGFGALLEAGAFQWCITLNRFDSVQMERLERHDKTYGSLYGDSGVYDGRLGRPAGYGTAARAAASASSGAGTDARRNGTEHALHGGTL